jgi:hypothetical protein
VSTPALPGFGVGSQFGPVSEAPELPSYEASALGVLSAGIAAADAIIVSACFTFDRIASARAAAVDPLGIASGLQHLQPTGPAVVVNVTAPVRLVSSNLALVDDCLHTGPAAI